MKKFMVLSVVLAVFAIVGYQKSYSIDCPTAWMNSDPPYSVYHNGNCIYIWSYQWRLDVNCNMQVRVEYGLQGGNMNDTCAYESLNSVWLYDYLKKMAFDDASQKAISLGIVPPCSSSSLFYITLESANCVSYSWHQGAAGGGWVLDVVNCIDAGFCLVKYKVCVDNSLPGSPLKYKYISSEIESKIGTCLNGPVPNMEFGTTVWQTPCYVSGCFKPY